VRWSTLKEKEVTYELELDSVDSTVSLYGFLTKTQISEEENSLVSSNHSVMVTNKEFLNSIPKSVTGNVDSLEISKSMISESAHVGDRAPNLPMNTHGDLNADEPTFNGIAVPPAPPPPPVPQAVSPDSNVVVPKLQQQRVSKQVQFTM